MEVYILKDEQKRGPFSEEDLRQRLASGEFASTDQASTSSGDPWQPLSSLMHIDAEQQNVPPSVVQAPPITLPLERMWQRARVIAAVVGRWIASHFSTVIPAQGPLWNPLAVVGLSLVFTPLLGSVLVYVNWMRLGRPKRAQAAAGWFWGSVAWLLVCAAAPPAIRPPFWAYLVFLGAWIGLVAYPQYLTFNKRFPDAGYPKASWNAALLLGAGGTLLLLLLHTASGYVYGRSYTPKVAAPDNPKPAVVDNANKIFTAEEITQRFCERIFEVGVQWKEAHGFWIFKSEEVKGGEGSGLLLANDQGVGLVVTNWHVVTSSEDSLDGSYRCGVRQDASQKYVEAIPVAYGKSSLDLALLLVKLDGWPTGAVPVRRLARLQQGEGVVAIGNALGEGISTTNGVISHFDPFGSSGLRRIRTSSPISPGNSGGPLFSNRGGFYVGITTASRADARAQNYNIALPAEYALEPDNWTFFNEEARQVAGLLLDVARQREQP